MQVGIAHENKTSLDLCRCLFGGIPIAPNWRIAVPYIGCEQSPEDIRGGVLFTCDGSVGHINAINCSNLCDEDLQDITASVSRYLHKRGVDTLLLQCLPSDFVSSKLISNSKFTAFDRRFISEYTLDEHMANLKKDFSQMRVLSVQDRGDTECVVQEMLSEMKNKRGYSFRRGIIDFDFWKQIRLACYMIDDTVAGFVLFSTLYDFDSGKTIHMVYTLPKYRRMGIGKTMVDFAKFCLGPGEISMIDFYFADAHHAFFERCEAFLESTVYAVFASDYLEKRAGEVDELT